MTLLIQAGRVTIFVLLLFSGIAWGQSSLIEDLHTHILKQDSIVGSFSQCIKQGAARMSASGRYVLDPENQFQMIFEKPDRHTMVFYKDGTYVRKIGGTDHKAPRYSLVGSLIYPVLSMRKARVERRFRIETKGSFEKFSISLTPRKRLKKVLQTIQITGTDGHIETFRITTRDHREISIYLYLAGELPVTDCG